MRKSLSTVFLIVVITTTGCSGTSSKTSGNPSDDRSRKVYVIPSELVLSAHADRRADGAIVISGTSNLPDELKMWVEIEAGKLPLGAPKVVASDEAVFIKDGTFQTDPLWLDVPNTTFKKAGWPKRISVNLRQKPFPQGPAKVHFEAYFNGAWQSNYVLAALGSDEGKSLRGPILKATDSDIVDSPKILDYRQVLALSVVSPEAKAISLIRSAVLTVRGEGRSAGDIQANIDLYTSPSGISVGKGWTAKAINSNDYEVSYDFINGSRGDEQAIWKVNLVSAAVKYVNESAKTFSWSPNY